jgi:hypothetical protein
MVEGVWLAQWILIIVGWPAILVGLFAFIHAAFQRADAFTAADKLTKPAWLGITGGATLLLLLCRTPDTFLWIVGVVAALVYIVDVKPKVTEVQRGSSSW